MRLLLFPALFLSSITVFASAVDCEDKSLKELNSVMEVVKVSQEKSKCPNEKKLKNICLTIEGRTKHPSPEKHYKHLYQKKLLDAACVNLDKDNSEEVSRKVSTMWNQLENKLTCNNVAFDVPNGSIIKYAVTSKFDAFIYDVIEWKVNLNRVDKQDGRTVLDYVKYQWDLNKKNPVGEQMEVYYKALKRAGAKHKSEL